MNWWEQMDQDEEYIQEILDSHTRYQQEVGDHLAELEKHFTRLGELDEEQSRVHRNFMSTIKKQFEEVFGK